VIGERERARMSSFATVVDRLVHLLMESA